MLRTGLALCVAQMVHGTALAQSVSLSSCAGFARRHILVPGTDTCTAIGGVLRADYAYLEAKRTANTAGRAFDVTGFGSGLLLTVDSRTATGHGTVRSFAAVEFLSESGALVDGVGGASRERVDFDKAFVEFAGFTVGLARSFFDFYGNTLSFGSVGGSDTDSVMLAAHSRDLGGGWRVHVSAEDTAARRQSSGNIPLAGIAAPDAVVALRYGGRGFVRDFQLSAAARQLRFNAISPSDASYPATRLGYAAQAGVAVDAGALLRDGIVWLQGTYAEGAPGYLGLGNVFTSLGLQNLAQAEVLALDDGIDLTRGWAMTAALRWRPSQSVRHSVFASTIRLDYAADAASRGRFLDAHLTQVGTNAVWSPVRDVDLGIEVIHHRVDLDDPPPGGGPKSEAILEGRLRAKRFF